MRTSDQGEWWPDHMNRVFIAIGEVMRSERLYPEDLRKLPAGVGAILPEHQVEVTHVPGKEAGHRKGNYVITIEGAAFAGSWRFFSGELEKQVLNVLRRLGR